jgi:hypothetical protein
MELNVGCGSSCILCYAGKESKKSLKEYIGRCRRNGGKMADEIEVFINSSYFEMRNTKHILEKNTEDSFRTIGIVFKTDIDKMLSGESPKGCRIVFKEFPETYVPQNELFKVGVTDYHMSYDEAVVVNAPNSIMRLHNEGYQGKHCWIHKKYASKLKGRARTHCIGCMAPYGENGVISTIVSPLLDPEFFTKLCSLMDLHRTSEAIAMIEMIDEHSFDDQSAPWLEDQMLLRIATLTIQLGNVAMFDYLLGKFKDDILYLRNHCLSQAMGCFVTLEMFMRMMQPDINDGNRHHVHLNEIMYKHSEIPGTHDHIDRIFHTLILKIQYLVSHGSDPRNRTNSHKRSSFDVLVPYSMIGTDGKDYVLEIFDVFFKYARKNTATGTFDPNAFFRIDTVCLHLPNKKNHLAFLKYMHEVQGASIDYTNARNRNLLFYICDMQSVEYLCRCGVNKFHTTGPGNNIVTFILQRIHACSEDYSGVDILEYLKFLMLSGVNSKNRKNTELLLGKIKFEDRDNTSKVSQRNSSICKWFETYYAKEPDTARGQFQNIIKRFW